MLILFDFICNSCNNKFEKLVDSKDRATQCPKCNMLASKAVSHAGLYKTNFHDKNWIKK